MSIQPSHDPERELVPTHNSPISATSPAAGQGSSEDHVTSQSSRTGPVKRRKRDESDRTRVSRACDRCKRKKTRCSGRLPCTLCIRTGMNCQFTAAYNRGRVPSVMVDDASQANITNVATPTGHGVTHATVGGTAPENTALDQVLRASDSNYAVEPSDLEAALTSPQQAGFSHRSMDNLGPAQHRALNSGALTMPSSRNSPEPSQTDLQGHYVGPSSGVSFLLRVQKKLHNKVSFAQNSSIFTFGDAPLPEFEPSFFVLPLKSDAEQLVARYFDFAVPTHRFLHRPTVEAWLHEFYENLGVMRQKDGARERTALLFMVFAQAKDYMPQERGSNGLDTSARYFQAADHQLTTETGEIRLTSIQARLCQCFYLLSQSRVNHCWSLFGTTAHLILALGIHRKRRAEMSVGVDQIDLECRKRVFWCAYSLDNYLSAALGRPRTFHDDDIDQELPNNVNDFDLTPNGIKPSKSKAQSVMMAPVAHTLLSKIVSHILRDLYCIRLPPLPTRISLAAKYSAELLSWRTNLARFLDSDGVDTSLLIPLFQRQRNVLNLAYFHALILVHRPFLLSNFASLNRKRVGNSQGEDVLVVTDQNVSSCLDAAMNIASIVNELNEGNQIYRAFWFTHYFAFCATVVLYVYTIQQRGSPKDKDLTYFNTATKCQAQITSIADKNSLAQRYSVVLEELRLEASKQTQNENGSFLSGNSGRESMAPQAEMLHQRDNGGVVNGNGNQVNDDHQFQDENDIGFANSDAMMAGDQQLGATPNSMMADLTGWGEFDSLVTAGIGGLDFMFMGDQNLSWSIGNDDEPVMLP